MRRKVTELIYSRMVTDGAGVRIRRVFGFHSNNKMDPFLLFDHFGSDEPEDFINGFPWHPHRGIETITFMLEGRVEHGDSIGNKGVLFPGDVQWMTAGGGIIHQEMPKPGADGRMFGFQLWANLPASHKMISPRYQEFKASELPVVKKENGSKVTIISGIYEGVKGPVTEVVIDPQYLAVLLPAGNEFELPVISGHKLFAYVYEGEGFFGEENKKVNSGELALFDSEGDFYAKAGEEETRFILVSGKPLNEPVAWGGPIVMNTQEELKQAFADLQNGTFIRK